MGRFANDVPSKKIEHALRLGAPRITLEAPSVLDPGQYARATVDGQNSVAAGVATSDLATGVKSAILSQDLERGPRVFDKPSPKRRHRLITDSRLVYAICFASA